MGAGAIKLADFYLDRTVETPSDALIVYCTCPPGDAADMLAGELVGSGLAACVNRVGPVVSTYRWRGEIQHDDEALLIIKTTQGAYPALEQLLARIHPYELPEIVAVPITTGLPAYLDWVAGQARATDA